MYSPDTHLMARYIIRTSHQFNRFSALSMFAVGAPKAASDFNLNSESLVTFVVSIYLIGYAISNVTISLFSQRYGRLLVFHLPNLFFIGFSVACARSTSFAMLIIFRYLQGFAGSGPVYTSSGILADLLPRKYYYKYDLVLITLSFADSVGLIAGAFLVSAKGWRWIFWLLAIAVSFALSI
jgi:MFS family permease